MWGYGAIASRSAGALLGAMKQLAVAEKPKPASCWESKHPFVALSTAMWSALNSAFSSGPKYNEILFVYTSADLLPHVTDKSPLKTALN